MSFEVNLPPDTFELSRSGVVGQIWLVVDGEAYPGKAWTDFVDPAATKWLREACSLALGGYEARLEFMEGPFAAQFRTQDGQTIHGRLSGSSAEFTVRMRIPGENDHPFRRKPITDSDAKRSPIPAESDHLTGLVRNG